MNEETIFHVAREKPVHERAAFLDEACIGDAGLRRRVEVLLQAHDNPGSFLANPAPASPEDRPPPSLPGDYEIVREIGRGGMGVVYLAHQKSLGRDVAVKVLRPGEMTFGPLVKRFLEEARHLARLRHPNIVSIHEIGQADSEPYFTMDYVEGEPLSAVLARSKSGGSVVDRTQPYAGPEQAPSAREPAASNGQPAGTRLTPTQALALLKQVAAGVQHAHEHGIIHRDLKPGNILVDPAGHACVTDFGLARDMAQSSKLTRSGEVMGTPAYMAPEQARGQKNLIGEATDVHALGVILYEMLTGQLPYGCDAPANVIVRLLTDEPRPPRKLDRRIPRDLETICLTAMAKAPERRYPSVRAFLEDIRRFESGEPVLARRPGPLYRAGRFMRRHWKLGAAVIVTAAIVLGAGLAVAPWLFDKSAEELVKWADEERFRGEHASAVRIYGRAYLKSSEAQRHRILGSMLESGRAARDPKAVATAALGILDIDPDVSFQEFDYAVADAWQARLQTRDLGRLDPDGKRRVLELGEKRLMLVLAGSSCTEADKKEAQKHLAEVRHLLAALTTMPDLVFELPNGSPDALLRRAADSAKDEWSRGTAAFAAGAELEKAGNLAAALKAYQQAYDLMRPAFPTYAGKKLNIEMDRTVGRARELKECRMLRLVQQSIRRLDPASPDTLRGGIRFRIVGVNIPATQVVYLSVALYDPKLKNPMLWPTPNGTAPSQLDQTIWVGVADGKYALRVEQGGSYSMGASGDFELDFTGLPREVEIAGETIEIPIRAHPRQPVQDIVLESPAAGETVDLPTATFRWSAVPEAKSFRIRFGWTEKIPYGSRTNFLPDVTVDGTSFSLTNLPSADAAKFKPLKRGVTGTWDVTAYDAAGRTIGKASRQGSFTVARELGEK